MDSLSAFVINEAYLKQQGSDKDLLRRVYPYLENRVEGQEILTYAAGTHRISDFQAMYSFDKIYIMCEKYMRNGRAEEIAEDICEAFGKVGSPIKGYEEHMTAKEKGLTSREPEFFPGF